MKDFDRYQSEVEPDYQTPTPVVDAGGDVKIYSGHFGAMQLHQLRVYTMQAKSAIARLSVAAVMALADYN